MPSTILNDLDYAQLAQAAYSDLNASMDRGGDAYIAALEQSDGAGMSDVQAQQFAETYQVIDQSPSNTNSGFSATVFEKGGQYVISVRGTQGTLVAGAIDWLSADFADIGGNGIAVHQAIDLFNYFQRLNARKDSTVYQYVYDDNSQEIIRHKCRHHALP